MVTMSVLVHNVARQSERRSQTVTLDEATLGTVIHTGPSQSLISTYCPFVISLFYPNVWSIISHVLPIN